MQCGAFFFLAWLGRLARNQRGWELAVWWRVGKGSSPRHAECINLRALCFECWGALKCLAVVFLPRTTSIWVEVDVRPTQRQVFTWALLRRRAATDRLQGLPNLASLVLYCSSLGGSTITLSPAHQGTPSTCCHLSFRAETYSWLVGTLAIVSTCDSFHKMCCNAFAPG